tara:strand:- start:221 stop:475 length:255 start_codon:yes stop_codon:yes gene_type:complete
MNRKERIQSILSKNINDWEIEVIDNSYKHKGHGSFSGNEESHFKINLLNKSLDKPHRLEIHRKINNLLKEEFLTGLHALEINIL